MTSIHVLRLGYSTPSNGAGARKVHEVINRSRQPYPDHDPKMLIWAKLHKKQESIIRHVGGQHEPSRKALKDNFDKFNLAFGNWPRKNPDELEAGHGSNVAQRIVGGNGVLYRLTRQKLVDAVFVGAWHDGPEVLGMYLSYLALIIGYRNANSVGLCTNPETGLGNYGKFMSEVYASGDTNAIITRFHDKRELLHNLMTSGFHPPKMVDSAAKKTLIQIEKLAHMPKSKKPPLIDIDGMIEVLSGDLQKFAELFGGTVHADLILYKLNAVLMGKRLGDNGDAVGIHEQLLKAA